MVEIVVLDHALLCNDDHKKGNVCTFNHCSIVGGAQNLEENKCPCITLPC